LDPHLAGAGAADLIARLKKEYEEAVDPPL